MCYTPFNYGELPKQSRSIKCASMDDQEPLSSKPEWKVCDNCHRKLLNTGSAASEVSGIEILPDEWRDRQLKTALLVQSLQCSL
jgi:hypothetical protein